MKIICGNLSHEAGRKSGTRIFILGKAASAGYRRVVIISGNVLSYNLPVVIVMPLTSKINKGNPVLVPCFTSGRSRKTGALKSWEALKSGISHV